MRAYGEGVPKTSAIGFVGLAVLLLALPGPGAPRAEVLVLPNADALPGELGSLMGGARTALVQGVEAGWYNPAGLSADPTPTATAGGEWLARRDVSVGGDTTSSGQQRGGYLAWSSGSQGRRGGPPFAVGLTLAWPHDLRLETRRERSETIDPAQVPPAVDPGGLDVFSDGLTRERLATGDGRMEVLAAGIALGVAVTSWLRLGVAWQWERARYRSRDEVLSLFSGTAQDSTKYTFRGRRFALADYAGQTDRTLTALGVQADLTDWLVVGVRARLPSETVSGTGSVTLLESSAGERLSDDTVDRSTERFIVVRDDGLRFRLRTPLEIHYGLGLVGQTGAVEFDLVRRRGVGPYTVMPLPDSRPPSTDAFRPPAFRTGRRAVTEWRVGGSYLMTDTTAAFVGLRSMPSGVPGRDRVFRRLDLHELTTGVLYTRQRFSTSVALALRTGQRPGVRFPEPLGAGFRSAAVRYDAWALRVGATLLL